METEINKIFMMVVSDVEEAVVTVEDGGVMTKDSEAVVEAIVEAGGGMMKGLEAEVVEVPAAEGLIIGIKSKKKEIGVQMIEIKIGTLPVHILITIGYRMTSLMMIRKVVTKTDMMDHVVTIPPIRDKKRDHVTMFPPIKMEHVTILPPIRNMITKKDRTTMYLCKIKVMVAVNKKLFIMYPIIRMMRNIQNRLMITTNSHKLKVEKTVISPNLEEMITISHILVVEMIIISPNSLVKKTVISHNLVVGMTIISRSLGVEKTIISLNL